MTITVKIEDANIAELLAKVEAGEDVLLVRNDAAVARLQAIPRKETRQQVIEDILEFRKKCPASPRKRLRSGRRSAGADEQLRGRRVGGMLRDPA